MRQALGAEFVDNALRVDVDARGRRDQPAGSACPPTTSRTRCSQFAFVNGRAVRDKLIAGALRGAYLDYLPRERHGAAVLFIDCDPREVDVNVHPAKAEVRFRDSGLVRGLIVSAVKHTLEAARHKAATTGGAPRSTLARARILRAPAWRPGAPRSPTGTGAPRPPRRRDAGPLRRAGADEASPAFAPSARPARAPAPAAEADLAAPLGAARAQVHETYIIAQTRDGVVIVDQHAAHERIVYEKLKRQREETGVERQILLSPLVIDLDPQAAAALIERAGELEALGVVVEGFGPGAVLLREAPTLIAKGDMTALIRDLAEEALAEDGAESLERRLDHRLATIACHHSVRAGRALRAEEMNALLREMEATPGAGQCNHGRPTYVELKLADIERLFGTAVAICVKQPRLQ